MSAEDVAAWDAIENKDDPSSLQQYLAKYPDGRFSSLARARLKRMGFSVDEDLEPAAAAAAPQPSLPPPAPQAAPAAGPSPGPRLIEPTQKNTSVWIVAALSVVLLLVGGAAGYAWWSHDQKVQAERAITAAWEAVPRDNPEALRTFLAGNPGPHRAAAEEVLQSLERQRFEEATASNTVESYEAFTAAFPDSTNVAQARQRILELRRAAERTAAVRTFTAPSGEWRGRMTQEGKRYEVVALFSTDNKNGLVARVMYVEPGCAGIWLGEPGSAGRRGPWALQEALDPRRRGCIGRGYVSLTPLAGDQIRMEYRSRPGGGPAEMSGVLRPRR